MTLADLIATAVLRADDTAAGTLWSEAEWIEYANDAQNEACRRARLIVDSTTTEVCNIELSDGVDSYALHDSVMFVRRVRLLDVDGIALATLGRQHVLDLDRCAGVGWQEEAGQPRAWVPDMDTYMLRPYPVPDRDYLAQLTVVRTPIAPMVDDDDTPEIRTRWHLGLVNWMMARAYGKQDSQCYNPKLAAKYETDFAAEFGRKSSAIDEAWLAREHDYMEAEGNF